MDLSIIIISYNTKDLLKQCLDSIVSSLKSPSSPISYEIIVVDNHSLDGSREYLKKLLITKSKKSFSKSLNVYKANDNKRSISLKIIFNDKNLGFAKANNQAIKIAKGKYVLLLNSDTKIIQKDFFSKAVSFLEKHHKVGILGPQLLWPGKRIQPSGGYFPNLWRLFLWAFFLDDLPFISSLVRAYHPSSKGKYFQKPHYQDWVTGACFWVRKKVLEQIGGLDEKFFMYAEEMEFCYRAQKKGWKVFYNPELKVVHYGGQSSLPGAALKWELLSLKYFFKKHFSPRRFCAALFFLKAATFMRMAIFPFLGQKEKGKIYKQAWEKLKNG